MDKTKYIEDLEKTAAFLFLIRPRRFGKSLLISTLEAYFLGKKELFEGLAIGELEQDWFTYPVLHLDLNAEKYDSKERLVNQLESQLQSWESTYGVTEINRSYSIRFMTVIRRAYEQTGRRVVVLIDEYDSPLQHSWKTPEHEGCTEVYRSVFSVLKLKGNVLRFVFITGITKFTPDIPILCT